MATYINTYSVLYYNLIDQYMNTHTIVHRCLFEIANRKGKKKSIHIITLYYKVLVPTFNINTSDRI